MHLSWVVVLSTGTTDASLTVLLVRTIARPGTYYVCYSLHPPHGLASVVGLLHLLWLRSLAVWEIRVVGVGGDLAPRSVLSV